MTLDVTKKNILVAPLNWGLGHATRCIPIIKGLEESGFDPILASDGQALLLLQKEFPHLKSLELPSYEIEYAKG
jgi:UDP:flavonoid glycosyltransferase YjiC (YdhE family)